MPDASATRGAVVSDLARALLDELAGDQAELDRLADLLADRVASRLRPERDPIKGSGLVSIKTAATSLGCSPQTVRRRIADRSLPAVIEHGRIKIRADDLRAYIEGLDRTGIRPRPSRARHGADPRLDFLRF